ncbi:GH36-type glycosyl hydrolase domain-containing protein [Clostridium sp. DL1XJH146]
MKYGYFNNEKKEYVITNPKTPVKWTNYIGGLDFGGLIDQTGGALICKGDPALNRIVKYIPQMPASELKGETLYIRIKKNDEYIVFSPFYVPTLTPYDYYECRVGNGYSVIKSEMMGVRTEVTIFVPVDSQREIRDIKVTNISGESLEIDIIPFVEYTHFEAMKQFNNADWVPQTMQSKCVTEEDGKRIIKQFAFMRKDTDINYFTSNYTIDSFETDRKIFLGDNGYGTFMKPLSLFEEKLSNYEALREDNIVAALHNMGTIGPGETKRIITQLGQYTDFDYEMTEIEKYRDEKNVDEAFIKLNAHWDKYLSKYHVETPDEDFNTLVNIHNPKQCMTTKNWSRFLSLYQLGLGVRGIGFRDTSQDLIGIMGLCADESVEMIGKLLSIQRRNGCAMHQFYPLTMEATTGEATSMEDREDFYGDDHLWIIQTVCEYLKESADYDLLNRMIPFYEKDSSGKPLEEASILEHLTRAIEFTHVNKGRHGIPLLGFADWNDCVNLPKGAESIFNANLYGKALLEMMDLMKYLGDEDMVNKYKAYYDEIKLTVNDNCWDGEWYLRYFDHEGNPMGSKVNKSGMIYTNAQSWTVMSGFAEGDRANQSLESLNKYLNTKNGIKLSYPGYNGYDPILGGVSTYPPGAKENGGIFLHSNPWVIIAETLVGNGDRAFEYYQQINPILKNDKIDEFEVEPYVFPQNILGDEHPQFGLGRNSWLSGTASWVYQAATKYILGIRAHYDGLIIDPCIPKAWDKVNITKEFKGAIYNITIENPNHISKGVKRIVVDGEELHTNKAPIFEDEGVHNIVAYIG